MTDSEGQCYFSTQRISSAQVTGSEGAVFTSPLNIFLLHRWQVQREQCYFSTQRISSAQVTGSEEGAVLLLHSTYFFCTGDRFRGKQCYFSTQRISSSQVTGSEEAVLLLHSTYFFCTGDRFRGSSVTSPLNVFLLHRWQVQREQCYFSTQRISSSQVTGSEEAVLLLHSTYFFCTGDRFRGSSVTSPLNVFLLHRWQVQREQCYFSTQTYFFFTGDRFRGSSVTSPLNVLLLHRWQVQREQCYFSTQRISSAQVTGSEEQCYFSTQRYFFCTGDRFRGSSVTSPLNVFLLHRWQVQRKQCYFSTQRTSSAQVTGSEGAVLLLHSTYFFCTGDRFRGEQCYFSTQHISSAQLTGSEEAVLLLHSTYFFCTGDRFRGSSVTSPLNVFLLHRWQVQREQCYFSTQHISSAQVTGSEEAVLLLHSTYFFCTGDRFRGSSVTSPLNVFLLHRWQVQRKQCYFSTQRTSSAQVTGSEGAVLFLHSTYFFCTGDRFRGIIVTSPLNVFLLHRWQVQRKQCYFSTQRISSAQVTGSEGTVLLLHSTYFFCTGDRFRGSSVTSPLNVFLLHRWQVQRKQCYFSTQTYFFCTGDRFRGSSVTSPLNIFLLHRWQVQRKQCYFSTQRISSAQVTGSEEAVLLLHSTYFFFTGDRFRGSSVTSPLNVLLLHRWQVQREQCYFSTQRISSAQVTGSEGLLLLLTHRISSAQVTGSEEAVLLLHSTYFFCTGDRFRGSSVTSPLNVFLLYRWQVQREHCYFSTQRISSAQVTGSEVALLLLHSTYFFCTGDRFRGALLTLHSRISSAQVAGSDGAVLLLHSTYFFCTGDRFRGSSVTSPLNVFLLHRWQVQREQCYFSTQRISSAHLTDSEGTVLLLHSTYFFCTGDRFRGSSVTSPLNIFLLHRWQVQREQCYFSTQRISSAQVTGSEGAVLLLHSTYFFCTGDRFRGSSVTSPLNVFLLHRWQVQRKQCYFSTQRTSSAQVTGSEGAVLLLHSTYFFCHRWQVQREQCYFSTQRISSSQVTGSEEAVLLLHSTYFFCTGDRFRGSSVTSPLNVFLLHRWQVQREQCYFSTQRISSAQVTGSEGAVLLLHSTYFFFTGDRFRGSSDTSPLNVLLLHRWQVQREQCYFSTQRISSAQVTGSEEQCYFSTQHISSAQVTGSEEAVLLLHSTYFFCTGDRFRGSSVTSPLNVFLLHRWQVQRKQCYFSTQHISSAQVTGSEEAVLLLHSTYFFCTGDRFRGSSVTSPLNVFLLHRWQVQRKQCYFSTQRTSSAQVTGSEGAVLLLHSTYFFCTGDRFRGIIVTSPLNVFLLHRWQVQRKQCYFSTQRISSAQVTGSEGAVLLLHSTYFFCTGDRFREAVLLLHSTYFFCTGDRFRGSSVTSPLNVFLLHRWQVQREQCYFSTQHISSAQVTGSEEAVLLLHSTYFFCTGDRFRGSSVTSPLNVFLLHRWQVQRKQCYFSTQRTSSAQVTGSEGAVLLLHSTYFFCTGDRFRGIIVTSPLNVFLLHRWQVQRKQCYFSTQRISSAQVTGSEGAVLLLHSTYFFCTGDRFRGSIVTSPLNVFLLHRWQVQR